MQEERRSFLCPPSLALVVAAAGYRLRGAALLSVAGSGWIWLGSTGAGRLWIGMARGSWSVLSSVYLGTAELLLLFASLLAARLP